MASTLTSPLGGDWAHVPGAVTTAEEASVFVGRRAQLDALRAALQRVGDGVAVEQRPEGFSVVALLRRAVEAAYLSGQIERAVTLMRSALKAGQTAVPRGAFDPRSQAPGRA